MVGFSTDMFFFFNGVLFDAVEFKHTNSYCEMKTSVQGIVKEKINKTDIPSSIVNR